MHFPGPHEHGRNHLINRDLPLDGGDQRTTNHPASVLAEAVEAARRGADSTSQLVRRKGRGSFLGERAKGHKDAGAEAVALILAALRDSIPSGTTSRP